MRKVNYKSLKSVDEFLKNKSDLFMPLGNQKPEPVFFTEYENRGKPEKTFDKFLEANSNWRSYKCKKANLVDNEIVGFVKACLKDKSVLIKKQVIDYVNILATDKEDAYFLVKLFSHIYNAENFQSKKNEGQVATDAERKELLDLPLRILKMHKSNEVFKLSVLYQMSLSYDYQYVLFNETTILCDLYNTDAFQRSRRNKKDFDLLCQEFLKMSENVK